MRDYRNSALGWSNIQNPSQGYSLLLEEGTIQRLRQPWRSDECCNAEGIFERQQAMLDKAWRKVERRHHLKGCYYNYPERDATMGDYFGGNVSRLRRIKKKYDPEAIFSHPQSF